MKNDSLPAMNNQKEWINVLKGIGILSVVVGHIVPGILSVIIYMFHMPLFFLISGYLFKAGKDSRVYFVEKIQHLIVFIGCKKERCQRFRCLGTHYVYHGSYAGNDAKNSLIGTVKRCGFP